jgi:hypothetical protein
VTSSTLRELGLRVDIEAKEFTIPGLVEAILRAMTDPASVTRSGTPGFDTPARSARLPK